MRALETLFRRYGLKQVLIERLTKETILDYELMLAVLHENEKALSKIRAAHVKVKRTLASTKPGSPDHKKAMVLNKNIEDFLSDYQQLLLMVGAAGRLSLSDGLEVLPLDDAEWLEKAKPIIKDGKIRFNEKLIEKREDAMVKNAMKAGSVAVVICGGSHDLADNVRRLTKGRGRYVRVMVEKN